MLIGIVSERAEEKTCFTRYVQEKIPYGHNPFELVAVRLPYTAERLEKLNSKHRSFVIKKAIRRLEKGGLVCVVLSDRLKKYKAEATAACKDICVAEGGKVFYKFVPDAIRKAASRCSIRLLDAKVCIRAVGQDRITEYLMRELCYDIKDVTILTDDAGRIRKLCEGFAEETGLLPQIADIQSNVSGNADVLIDPDGHRVRIGRNIVIDGVEFDFKLNGYCVDMLDIAACLTDVDLQGRVISYKCGKNKLTL